MTEHDDGAGVFGKLPSHGDFISRRLPRDFIGPWDAWLQAGLAESRLHLSERWLPVYLNSPAWRFALAAGVCGPAAWVGVMIPSVDRVGRYFPLTLALGLPPGLDLRLDPGLELNHGAPSIAAPWYDQLEGLALSCLAPDFSLALFDAALAGMTAPAPPRRAAAQGRVRLWRTDAAGRAMPALAWSGLPAAADFAMLLAGG